MRVHRKENLHFKNLFHLHINGVAQVIIKKISEIIKLYKFIRKYVKLY